MIKKSRNGELVSSVLLNYLANVQSISAVIKTISKVLDILDGKRTTVAEKAIQEELTLCAELDIFFLYSFAKALKEKKHDLSETDCYKLRAVNIKLNKKLQAFIKAARYNQNYLEQYFEHDFWLELTNDRFAEQLAQVKIEIEAKKH